MSKSRRAPEKAKSTKAKSPKAKSRRSIIERVIVWGGIAVLLLILVVEFRSHSRWDSTQRKLLTEFKKVEDANQHLTEEDVNQLLNGRTPDASKSDHLERFDVYYFPGVLKRRLLCVHYKKEGADAPTEVLGVSSHLPEIMRNN